VSDGAPTLRAFLLDRFADFLALERGTSPRTHEAYLRDVTRLAAFAVARGAPTPVDMTARLLRTYVYHLKDLGLAPASIRRNVSAARTYFRFLLADGHVVRDPTERLETPLRWRTLPEVLTVSEVKVLL
jgi:integrase/recombinase XerD